MEQNKKTINDLPILNIREVKQYLLCGDIDALVIPIDVFEKQKDTRLILQIKREGIDLDNVYLMRRINQKEKLLEKYLDAKFLPYLEYHIADNCNLNCASCGHFFTNCKEKNIFKR